MIQLTAQAVFSNFTENSFLLAAEEKGYTRLHRTHYNTTVEKFPEEIRARATTIYEGMNDREAIIVEDNGISYLRLSSSWFYLWYCGHNLDDVPTLVESYQKLIPKAVPANNTAPITFWTLGKDGPRGTYKELLVPAWEDVQDNYPAKIREELDRLIGREIGNEDGRLVLWRGQPGTGKTYAIRALARAWKPWCSFNYIADPEKFFGDANYMMNVMTATTNERWNLLILEDSGELLSPDAKDRAGQGLSRLLNLVDGLLGQGSKLMVLITTNEEEKSMHPAITRSGRCSCNLEFLAFDCIEANAWWEAHESDTRRGSGYYTLAQMYALMRGEEISNDRKALIGFAA